MTAADYIYLGATVVQCAAFFHGTMHYYSVGLSSVIYGAALFAAAVYQRMHA